MAKLFTNYKDNSIELLEEFYNQLQSKNQELIEAKTIKVRDSEIVDYIKTKLNESEELDIEELKLLIASREVK